MVDYNLKERIKGFHIGSWFLLVFLVSIGVLIYTSRYLPKGDFQIGANVNYATDNPNYFNFPWNKFLQIVCIGPVFGIVYYIIMRIMLSKADKDKGKNKYYIALIEIGVVVLIALNSMAHLSHLGFEEVNAIDGTNGAALTTEFKEMFVYAWYMDEWLGHSMAQITYFGYLVLAVLAEQLLDDQKRVKIDEFLLLIIGGIAIAFMDGDIALSSESGFLLLICHIVFTIAALIVVLVKKIDILKNPILIAMLIALIGVAYFNIQFIMERGMTSYYPFYSSNLS